ncbi:hypothetical protein [Arthrobacter sp. CG_A4]|uniref:hypothetical protein n=1 Tax=Arthrobacter sp. CG_A4 TaxID=3071706 RepID=UPI002E08A119|nr:hypothetical protein [Arthrobacter sp. CG_A4]
MDHPGPRQNSWAGPSHWGVPLGDDRVLGRGPRRVPALAMLRALWWSGQFHADPATGLPGTIRQRAVPSAGACYPVQLHVLCGAGCDVPPGAYAFDADRGLLVRRGDTGMAGSAAGGTTGTATGAVVVFTALPQRTAAKYHHRAWPLALADTAYAVAALVHHAAALGIEAEWPPGGPEHLAAALGLPDYSAWQARWPDTAPELALAAVALGAAGTLPTLEHLAAGAGAAPSRCADRRPRSLAPAAHWIGDYRPGLSGGSLPFHGFPGVTASQLARRRSAAVGRPSSATGIPARELAGLLLEQALATLPLKKPASCRVLPLDDALLQDPLLADQCAGQQWIRNLDGMLLFQTSAPPDPTGMWWAASLSAHILYTALAADAPLHFRPIGGWTGTQDGWTTLHGLGFTAGTPPERTPHAGQ